MELYDIKKIYSDFEYPAEFVKIAELNLADFDMWYLMDAKQVDKRIKGLQDRYPSRQLIPFARRDDCDDIACFEVGKGNRVQIVHDYASAGWERRKGYECFWDWFRCAIEEMIAGDEE